MVGKSPRVCEHTRKGEHWNICDACNRREARRSRHRRLSKECRFRTRVCFRHKISLKAIMGSYHKWIRHNHVARLSLFCRLRDQLLNCETVEVVQSYTTEMYSCSSVDKIDLKRVQIGRLRKMNLLFRENVQEWLWSGTVSANKQAGQQIASMMYFALLLVEKQEKSPTGAKSPPPVDRSGKKESLFSNELQHLKGKHQSLVMEAFFSFAQPRSLAKNPDPGSPCVVVRTWSVSYPSRNTWIVSVRKLVREKVIRILRNFEIPISTYPPRIVSVESDGIW